MNPPRDKTTAAGGDRRSRRRLMAAGGLVLMACLGLLLIWLWPARPAGPQPELPSAEVPLADGRIFQIEAVTYGTHHAVGRDATLYKRLGSVLPRGLSARFQPREARNEIHTAHPSLVVWVNALDSVTRTNVDCQAVRVELGGADGEWFGEHTRSWFGGAGFWRVGHVFYVYPRHLTNLAVRITPWKTNAPVETVIPNPAPAILQPWTGLPLPQEAGTNGFAVRLAGLTLRTNHGQPRYYQTATLFWDPTWQILKDGKPVTGWQEPVWIAEDSTGNRGEHLGSRAPVLRYSVICYPSSTNQDIAEVVTRLPAVDLSALTNAVATHQTFPSSVGEIRFVGVFPPSGMRGYAFSEGEFDPTHPMGSVSGGAPSGWTGSGGFVNPIREKWYHGHYTPWPTFYLRAHLTNTAARLGVRLRDAQGNLIATRMEPQGTRTGIWPYLASDATNLTAVTPEIVLLRPLEAAFDVDTTTLSREPGSSPPEGGPDRETAVDLFD